MGKQFLDDETLYRFVSSEYYAQCVEGESGIEMSWADMGGSDELEAALSALPEQAQEEFEEDLKEAVSDPDLVSCFEQMDELIHTGEDSDDEEDEEDEDKPQRLKELQSDAMDIMRDLLGDYLI